MKKETLADKLAKKSFESESFQKSWRVHMQAFGPILEPAFAEDYQSRIHLTAALNHISRREVQAGFDKLKSLKNACQCDADHAALLFFLGLCFEFAGDKENMLGCYTSCAEYGHKFYLPYLKVAKSAHADAVFEVAEANYRSAIACYDGVELDTQSRIILASAFSNLASCLTMMHRFDEAEKALADSESILPLQQGRDATKAILFAAMGRAEEAEQLVNAVATQLPVFAAPTQKTVTEILDGTHPHFYTVDIRQEEIDAFWDLFIKNAVHFSTLAKESHYEKIVATLQQHLKAVFPFMQRPCEIGIMHQEYGYEITFADFYMVSLRDGYEKLIAACPEALRQQWHFVIAH